MFIDGDGFKPGQRVQAHPGTDCWMQGDRFGTVERVGRITKDLDNRWRFVYVKMDASGKVRKFHPGNLTFTD